MPAVAYGPLCTQFYDLDKPRAPADALSFYLRRLAGASPILEPMCGSGRFLLPLLERGLDADGADASEDMLEACRARCQTLGYRPGLWHQSLESLDLQRRYAAAFIPAGSFSLLADDAACEALRRLHAHLLPWGRLLVEFLLPVDGEGGPAERTVTRPDGRRIHMSSDMTVHPTLVNAVRCENRYELREGETSIATEQEILVLHRHARTDAERMLAQSGFGGIRAWRAYADRRPGRDDTLIVLEAARAAS